VGRVEKRTKGESKKVDRKEKVEKENMSWEEEQKGVKDKEMKGIQKKETEIMKDGIRRQNKRAVGEMMKI
jgi:hypothetical protein